MDTLLAYDLSLMHFFHSVDTFSFLKSHTPHFTETSFANHKLAVKMIAIYFFVIKHQLILDLLLSLQFGQINLKTVFYVLR
jgi:hypothetical protein